MAPKVAVCHEWVTTFGGSERVAQRIAAALNVQRIFTFTAGRDLAEFFDPIEVEVTSALGRSRFVREHWQYALPFMAGTWRRLDLSAYEVVVTSSHAAVNSIRVRPGALHISYCHTPMRYAWEWEEEMGRIPRPLRGVWPRYAARLRARDLRASRNVSHFVSNSEFVRDRIRRYYGRESTVIYPPVDTDFWTPPTHVPSRDYFLVAGRFVAYKRVDTAIRAANLSRQELVVAGSGPEVPRLKALAGPSVRFVDQPSNEELRDLYRNAKAFLLPGVEDFGITPVEAQACGCPVIAKAEGGALESVIDGETGVLYDGATPEALAEVLNDFDPTAFLPESCRVNAERFATSVFDNEIKEFVSDAVRQTGSM